MSKGGCVKPIFSRSVSAKPPKNTFEYDVDGELTALTVNNENISSNSNQNPAVISQNSRSNSRNQTTVFKYKKSSSRGNSSVLTTSRSTTSLHHINSSKIDVAEKLKIIAQNKFYLLPHETSNCFIVIGESSSKYKVNIGPQTCSCIASTSVISYQSFPCVHLLFVMCKVLQVSHNDPILVKERLRSCEVEILLNRFNKRKKEKVRNPCKSTDKASSECSSDISHIHPSASYRNNSRYQCTSPNGNNQNSRRNQSSYQTSSNTVNKRDSNTQVSLDEIMCSICLSEMNTQQQLDFCTSCSNEFHKKCISIWIKECRKQDDTITCPLCRNVWQSHSEANYLQSHTSHTNTNTIITNTNISMLPRSQSTFVSSSNHNQRYNLNSTSNNPPKSNTTNSSMSCLATELPTCNIYLNTPYTDQINNNSIVNTENLNNPQNHQHKPIGFCFSQEVSTMLTSELSEKREAGLRQVAEKTVHIVLSAGTAYSNQTTEDNNVVSNVSVSATPTIRYSVATDDLVGCMGGHTTGVVLKEAFRVIAKLLDDPCYDLFVAALRAFREILGYLLCRTEAEIDRMSRMISPVICQLLRICGDFSQKKKSQMSLSALFELAKGQEGGIALGRELKKSSLAVTGCDRLAKFVLGISNSHHGNGTTQFRYSSHSRFRVSHCYGRLALLERLLDKFDLSIELLSRVLEMVASQLQLMHRAGLLVGALIATPSGASAGNSNNVETTDVDSGLSSSDIRLLSSPKLQKLGRVLFTNVAKVTMAKLKFSGWTSDDIYAEINKQIIRIPDNWRDKFLVKLKFPPVGNAGIGNSDNSNNNSNNNSTASNNNNSLVNLTSSSSAVALPLTSSTSFSKSYRMSKRFSQNQNKLSTISNSTTNLSIKARTRSLGGNSTSHTGININHNTSSSINRISPFIRITPEPAYDSVALSDNEEENDDEDDDDDDDDDDVGVKEIRRRSNAAFFCELAIHNRMYGSMTGVNTDDHDQNESMSVSQEQQDKQCDLVSVQMLKAILKEQAADLDDTSMELESRGPPGLGIFLPGYRQGQEWLRGHLLGTGAFSKCYQARDVRTGLLMAVKCQQCTDGGMILATNSSGVNGTISTGALNAPNQDSSAVARAVRTEVQLMSRLRHPNVLPLLGAIYCPVSATVSVFVRWMPGGSVASLLHHYGAFREPVTLAYSLQAARGLAYIHDKRILHRDLKGANLLLDTSGMRLRISDFGASARLTNGRDSNASDFRGQLLGTIAFMAPEVLRGEQYGRSCDVWSFGCCIIEMLTGSQPWRDRNHTNHLALMYTIASANEPPKFPDKISDGLKALLNKCFSNQAKQRPLSHQLENAAVYQEFLK